MYKGYTNYNTCIWCLGVGDVLPMKGQEKGACVGVRFCLVPCIMHSTCIGMPTYLAIHTGRGDITHCLTWDDVIWHCMVFADGCNIGRTCPRVEGSIVERHLEWNRMKRHARMQRRVCSCPASFIDVLHDTFPSCSFDLFRIACWPGGQSCIWTYLNYRSKWIFFIRDAQILNTD